MKRLHAQPCAIIPRHANAWKGQADSILVAVRIKIKLCAASRAAIKAYLLIHRLLSGELTLSDYEQSQVKSLALVTRCVSR